jgi:hypothetical protein
LSNYSQAHLNALHVSVYTCVRRISVTVHSQRVTLRGSPTLAQIGHPFTLTCTVGHVPDTTFLRLRIRWYPVEYTVYMYGIIYTGACDISPPDTGIYELDCGNMTSHDEYELHLTIPNVTASELGKAWSCEETRRIGGRSNEVVVAVGGEY